MNKLKKGDVVCFEWLGVLIIGIAESMRKEIIIVTNIDKTEFYLLRTTPCFKIGRL